MAEWINEALYPNWGQRFEVIQVLARETSPYQEILIIQTASHGRVLLLDGCVQITEADEFAYQEMITHVPLLIHGQARRVLIIGAGDGGVLRRVLQHPGVERATMVEIDGAVVRLARSFMPEIAGHAWDDPRSELIIGDGVEYVAGCESGSFDVIIVDSTDPAGVGEVLFTESFYQDCADALTANGIIVTQSGVPFMQPEELRETSMRRAKAFARVTAYIVAVPTYVGGFMTLGIAAKTGSSLDVTETEISARAETAGLIGLTEYWSPAVQHAAFQLPPYILRLLP